MENNRLDQKIRRRRWLTIVGKVIEVTAAGVLWFGLLYLLWVSCQPPTSSPEPCVHGEDRSCIGGAKAYEDQAHHKGEDKEP
jgi:hypothetical protein